MSPFDAARYARLLEGLEISEIKLSNLSEGNDVFRIDAEYFGKDILAAIKLLQAADALPLVKVSSITDGIHTSLPFIQGGPVRVLSAKHPKNNYIARSHFETISAAYHAKNPRTALRKNDVLLSTVGTIGNSAVVTEDLLPANSDRHIGIIRITDTSLSPHFLSTFLVSRFGRMQSTRETTGNVQPNLFISKIGRLLIPRFCKELESAVSDAVRTAYATHDKASAHLKAGESLLLEKLGLENWQAPEPLSYVRRSCEAFAAGRLDAEFFSPRTNAIRAILREKGDLPFSEIGLVSTGHSWRSDRFIERGSSEGIPFVRIRDCKPGAIDGDDLDRLPETYAKEANQPMAQPGDLVIGMDGLRWFYASSLLTPCYVNQRVGWLHSFQDSFTNAYLMVVLNSLIGQSQLLSQMTIAQTVGHITLDDLRNLRIPTLQAACRATIAGKFMEHVFAKRRALELLTCAKRAIEIAIEDSESAALKYLEAFK